ncbi:MAG TPA: phage/plasmid primase, P4 family, partial [bacterium]|nr:phage/plasmid primase, P4 family [bacterium]
LSASETLRVRRARQRAAKHPISAPNSNKRQVDIHSVVKTLLSETMLKYLPSVGFYVWLETGVWRARSDEYILQLIEKQLHSGKRFTRSEIQAALIINSNVLMPPEQNFNSRRDLLNLKNGMFSLDDMTLLSHSPEYSSSIQLAVSYDPTAQCPRWLQFLQEVLPNEEDRMIVQEMFGYCLTTDTHHEAAFILIGQGRNGKSVLIDLLVHIVGAENTSRVQPTEIGKMFCTIGLKDKLLNVCSDIETHEIVNTGMLKAIISGEAVEDSFKHKNRVQFTPFAKLVFATNTPPRTTDRTEGFYRRLIFISFPVAIPEERQDKRLKQKLRTETDGIFLWALEGLRRLRENNGFTKSGASERFMEDFRIESDPLAQFIEECLDTSDPNAKTPKNVLFAKYQQWSNDSGYRPLSAAIFYRNLKHKIDFAESRSSDGEGSRVRYIHGVKIVKLPQMEPY